MDYCFLSPLEWRLYPLHTHPPYNTSSIKIAWPPLLSDNIVVAGATFGRGIGMCNCVAVAAPYWQRCTEPVGVVGAGRADAAGPPPPLVSFVLTRPGRVALFSGGTWCRFPSGQGNETKTGLVGPTCHPSLPVTTFSTRFSEEVREEGMRGFQEARKE